MKTTIGFPMATGAVADILFTTERRLNDVVRLGKIDPKPPIIAGRRLWGPSHVRQAAEVFGVLTPEIEKILNVPQSEQLAQA